MNHCPSHDWDRFNASEEHAAFDQARGELDRLAESAWLSILANPDQFVANMAPADMAELAYEAASRFIEARWAIEQAATCRGLRADPKTHIEQWAVNLVTEHLDL